MDLTFGDVDFLLAAVAADAADLLGVPESELAVTHYVTTFSSSALGLPGIGLAAVCAGDVSVAHRADRTGAAVVYLGGRRGYVVRTPNARFWAAVADRSLQEATVYERTYGYGDPAPVPALFQVCGAGEARRLDATIGVAWERAHAGEPDVVVTDEAGQVVMTFAVESTQVSITDAAGRTVFRDSPTVAGTWTPAGAALDPRQRYRVVASRQAQQDR